MKLEIHTNELILQCSMIAATHSGSKPDEAPPAASESSAYTAFASLGRDTLDAAARSNVAWSAGIEAIGQEIAGLARANFESAARTARALLAARTLDDVLRLQTELAQTQFERLVDRSAAVTDLGCSAAREALASWSAAVEPRR